MNEITLSELCERANKLAQANTDYYTNQNSLTFNNGIARFITEAQLFNAPLPVDAQVSHHALSQIATQLDAPSMRWLADSQHCPQELQDSILNYLVGVRRDARMLMRLREVTEGSYNLRAYLSDEYQSFDNHELLDMVEKAVSIMGIRAIVHRPELGDYLRAYILFPDVTIAQDPRAHGNGDGGIHPACYVHNCEIGGRRLKIAAAVYERVCKNGIIYGWKAEDITSIIHRWKSKSVFYPIVENGIAVALKMSEDAATAFIESQSIPVEKSALSGLVNRWSEKYGLSVQASDNWLKAITNSVVERDLGGNDYTLFDVINGVTQAAQVANAAERETMEIVGGEILANRNRAARNTRQMELAIEQQEL